MRLLFIIFHRKVQLLLKGGFYLRKYGISALVSVAFIPDSDVIVKGVGFKTIKYCVMI